MGTDMEYRGHTVHKDTDLAEDRVAHNEGNVAGHNMGNREGNRGYSPLHSKYQ